MAETTENPNPETAPQPASGGGWPSTALKIGAFIAVVLSIECLIAFLLIPSADDVAAMAESRYGRDQIASDPVETVTDEEDELTVEVDLGQYSVTAFQPLSDTTLRIDFHLFGTVATEDEEQFQTLFAKNKNRLREQVIVTIRSSEVNDLTDAGLGLIKRRLQDKINRTLSKPLVKEVIISEFAFIEQ